MGCGSATGPTNVTDIADLLAYYDVPGAGIAVINDFALDYVESHGVMSETTLEPVTAQTLFQAASISKGVSATGMVHLAQDGVVSLDTEINDYLVSWKLAHNALQDTEKVTLRRLLSHTAGTTVSVRTPQGGVAAPVLVLATNAYTHQLGRHLGFLRGRILPLHSFSIASAPLTEAQIAALSWGGRQPFFDVRSFFDLFRLPRYPLRQIDRSVADHDAVGIGLLPRRELLESSQEVPHVGLSRHAEKRAVDHPVVVGVRVVLGLFERITAHVRKQRHPEFNEGFAPHTETLAPVLQEGQILPVLRGFPGLGIDHRESPGAGQPLPASPDHRFVDPLLRDLVADVVGPVHVELLLVGTEANGQGVVLDQDQVGRLQVDGEGIPFFA